MSEKEISQARIVVVIHLVAAVFAGWVSIQIALLSRSLFAGVFGLALLVGIGFLTEKLVSRKGLKFWLGNGVIIYLFFWLVTWIYLFNLI